MGGAVTDNPKILSAAEIAEYAEAAGATMDAPWRVNHSPDDRPSFVSVSVGRTDVCVMFYSPDDPEWSDRHAEFIVLARNTAERWVATVRHERDRAALAEAMNARYRKAIEQLVDICEPAQHHACFTGDCPHKHANDCIRALLAWAKPIGEALAAVRTILT